MNKKLWSNMKIVVISGGTGYLGKKIIQVLTETNLAVIAIGLDNHNDFADNDLVYVVQADITDFQIIKKIAEDIENKFGKIFAIIHAASAPLIRKPLLDLSDTDFNLQIQVNVAGGFNLFRSFYPLIEKDGAIIGIMSQAINPDAPVTPSGSYLPAKYALRGILKVLTAECQKKSTRVYGVLPAFMPGGLNSDLPKSIIEFIQKKSESSDITDPEKVARVIKDLVNNKITNADGKAITIPNMTMVDL